MNVLYFSKHCKNCETLISFLKANDSLDLVDKYVCVDNWRENGIRDDLNHNVTRVPVVFSPDYQEPLVNETLQHWVDFKINNSKTTQKIQKEPPKPKSIDPVGNSGIRVDEKRGSDDFLPAIQVSSMIPQTTMFNTIPNNTMNNTIPKTNGGARSLEEIKAQRDSLLKT